MVAAVFAVVVAVVVVGMVVVVVASWRAPLILARAPVTAPAPRWAPHLPPAFAPAAAIHPELEPEPEPAPFLGPLNQDDGSCLATITPGRHCFKAVVMVSCWAPPLPLLPVIMVPVVEPACK